MRIGYNTRFWILFLGGMGLIGAVEWGGFSLASRIGYKEEIQFHKLPEVIEIDSVYKNQQDSLYMDYLFKKDSFNIDYQNKLNRLEKKIK
jgi:hypothetical protein